MKVKYFIGILILFAGFANGQTSETIVSGRPGQAMATATLGKNVFQIETGFDYSGFSTKSSPINGKTVLNGTLLRFGFTENFEVHSGWEFRQDQKFSDDSLVWEANGVSFSTVGCRYHLLDGDGLKPSLAYMVSLKLNILDPEYNDDHVAPQIVLSGSSSLTDKVGLTLNLGVDFDGTSGDPAGLYVLNIAYSLGDKLSAFVENYGSFDKNNFETKFDGGLAFLVSNNLQLDMLGGYSSNDPISDYFVSVGVSWNVNFSKKEGQPIADPAYGGDETAPVK